MATEDSQLIQLIFPKYVAVLENVQIEDHYSIPGRTKNRFIDIALVDANGNLDVIEIKRPFDDVLLRRHSTATTSCQLEIYPARLCRPRSPVPSIEVGHRRRGETHQEVQRAIAVGDVNQDH